MIQSSIHQTCSRCIYGTYVSDICFDENGVCNYCHQIGRLQALYGTGEKKGISALNKIVDKIKKEGAHKKYDCIIGVSGGTDSSYLLLKAKEWGLRPLAVHYDNTWNSAVATMNIDKVTRSLNIDLYTHVINNKEADDLKLAIMKAGVLEFEADTDIAFVQVLRSAAARYKVRYILEGHSFIAEGISPVGGNYMDGAYIEDIHRRFGSRKLETFPNLTFFQFMKWSLIYRQKFIRPLWYISYRKQKAIDELQEKTGWKYYGGHHLENRASTFAHTIWLPQRFNADYRFLELAANVRNGIIDRDEGLRRLMTQVTPDAELVAYVKKRLQLTDIDYDRLLKGTLRTWRDFRTYKKRFERLRPLFYLLAKADLVPMSFYLKYCFPLSDPK